MWTDDDLVFKTTKYHLGVQIQQLKVWKQAILVSVGLGFIIWTMGEGYPEAEAG